MRTYIYTFVIAALGGFLFKILDLPLPWTLGPLATVAVLRLGFNLNFRWSGKIRNAAMMVLGYLMGSPFTQQVAGNVLNQLPVIVCMTLLGVALCLFGGYLTSRYTGISLSSGLLGSMPGGLSQMALVSKDIEGADASTVTLLQTIRLLTVLFIVPFAVFHGLADQVDSVVRTSRIISAGDISILVLFTALIIAAVYLAKRIGMIGPYAVAPVLTTAALVTSGINAPPLPQELIALAQICVGIKMGMEINTASLINWRSILMFSLGSVISVIAILAGVDYIYAYISSISFVTAFISTAPGGMTEMGLTAMMVHADLPTVISFQLFRLLFILLVGVPCLRWWLQRRSLKNA